MKVVEKDQSYQMQQLINLEEQDSTLKLLIGETYKSLANASSEEMMTQLKQ